MIPEITRGLFEVELDTVVPLELKKTPPRFIYSLNMKTTPIHILEILNYTHSYIIQLLVTHSNIIFASQGLRSALLIIPAHCHLLHFDSYAPCNDAIFSQSTRGFHFLSFECPEN